MAKVITRKDFPSINYSGDFDAAEKAQDEALKKLQMESHDAVRSGKDVGLMFKFQVADGYAHYRVAKVSPFTVEHIDYGDGYQADPILIRGLRLGDARALAAREYALYQMFEGRKHA